VTFNSTVTGNGGRTGVVSNPQYSATRGVVALARRRTASNLRTNGTAAFSYRSTGQSLHHQKHWPIAAARLETVLRMAALRKVISLGAIARLWPISDRAKSAPDLCEDSVSI